MDILDDEVMDQRMSQHFYASELRVVATLPRSMQSDKLYPSLLLHTTRNMLTNKANRRSRISLSNSIDPCSSLIQEETNPRSLEVPEPEQDTRSHTVKLYTIA